MASVPYSVAAMKRHIALVCDFCFVISDWLCFTAQVVKESVAVLGAIRLTSSTTRTFGTALTPVSMTCLYGLYGG